MSIKIIGAGLPRTGTTTLKRSLEILGYGKCYHMKELLVNPDMLPTWLELENTGNTDWDKLYDGYEATVDFPGYPWYKEHMKRYPDAKVILTVRSFESWHKSAYNTIWKAGPQTIPEKLVMMIKLLLNPQLRKVIKCIKFVKRNVWEKHFEGRFEDKAFAEKIFNQHIENVKANVPADKLLIYEVKDGWKPLCEFLGVPEPPEPLPHLNKKENFKTMLVELMKGNMA
jgi:sulfotransferase family protein